MLDKKLRKRFGKIGLVLGPGGTRGALEAGYLIPFSKYGIEFDYVVSASVGTLNAMGLVATNDSREPARIWKEKINGPSDIWAKNKLQKGRILSEVIENFSESLIAKSRIESVKKFAKAGLKFILNFDEVWNTSHILDPGPLIKGVIDPVSMETIQNSPIEWEIVCKEIHTYRKEFFSNRQKLDPEILRKVIIASFSIPGVFPVIEIEGKLYGDGAPALPIARAVQKGCSTIFVLCVHPEEENFKFDGSKQALVPLPKSAKIYLEMSGSNISNYEDAMIETAKILSTHIKIYVLRPKRLPKTVETLFIKKRERDLLIRYGCRAAEKLLRSLNLKPIE